MTKYIVIYHAPPSFTEKMAKASPKEGQAEMAKWMAWSKKLGSSLVDMGTPLSGGMEVSQSGSSRSKRDVTGYSIIEAKSMDAALKMMQGHPHIGGDKTCEIEIHEAAPLPGM